MKRAALLGGVALCILALNPAAGAEALKLARVMISTGGVAYTEFQADVTGDETLALPVRLDQVDDVLKSLVVFDPAGSIGGISLPGRAPLEQIFRDLPFTQADLASPAALLNALQGAEVEIEGNKDAHGRLLRVVQVPVRGEDGQVVETRHRVSLITNAGLSEVELESAEAIRFRDPALRDAVADALVALLNHKAQDSRTLEIALEGEGTRTVRVGFVAEAPLWKTAYRLVLPRQGEEALLQAWAVLENMTGHDWNDVQVTLLSGNPVTFRQALYESYYVDRPEVAVEVFGRVLPRKDTGAVPPSPPSLAQASRYRSEGARAKSMPAMPGALDTESGFSLGADAAEIAPTGGTSAVESEVATAQVIYPFPQPISLSDGDSAMLPLVNRAIPAERIALYQPETHARHPLAAVSLNNDGTAPLPPGIVTIFEQPGGQGANRFLGDAELAYLPSGDDRLVTFALDQDVLIDTETSETRDLIQARISGGMLRLVRQQRQTTIFRITNASDLPRKVVLEVPRRSGWRLDTKLPADDTSLTETHYRLPLAVDANATVMHEVVASRPVSETRRLVDLNPGQIAFYLRGQELPSSLEHALSVLSERQATLDNLRSEVRRLDAETKEIVADQDRLRQNLARVPQGSDLSRRYLGTLNAQEDRLDEIRRSKDRLQGEIVAAERALRDFVEGLSL